MNTQLSPARPSPRIRYSLSDDTLESGPAPETNGITAAVYNSELEHIEHEFPFSYAKGRVSPYTGVPIETDADYRAYISCLAMRRTATRAIDSAAAISHRAQGAADEARRVSAQHRVEAEKAKERAEVFHRELVALEAKVEQKKRTARNIFLVLIVPFLLFGWLALYLLGTNGRTDSNTQVSASAEQIEPEQIETEKQPERTAPQSSATTGGGTPRPDGYQSDIYIGNINSHKFHKSSCSHLPDQKNQKRFKTRTAAVNAGYTPCGICNP